MARFHSCVVANDGSFSASSLAIGRENDDKVSLALRENHEDRQAVSVDSRNMASHTGTEATRRFAQASQTRTRSPNQRSEMAHSPNSQNRLVDFHALI
jgi:hypothetical protein